MEAANLTALGFERRPGVHRILPGPTGLFGRGLAHLTIYVSALALFFLSCRGYTGSRHRAGLRIWRCSRAVRARRKFYEPGRRQFFKHRETAVLVFVATTLPQFFLVGVSWSINYAASFRTRRRSTVWCASVRSALGSGRLGRIGFTFGS